LNRRSTAPFICGTGLALRSSTFAAAQASRGHSIEDCLSIATAK
jgi:hypothetical protein